MYGCLAEKLEKKKASKYNDSSPTYRVFHRFAPNGLRISGLGPLHVLVRGVPCNGDSLSLKRGGHILASLDAVS